MAESFQTRLVDAMGDLSEPSGTGTRFGRVAIIFAGVAGLVATLITIVYVDSISPIHSR